MRRTRRVLRTQKPRGGAIFLKVNTQRRQKLHTRGENTSRRPVQIRRIWRIYQLSRISSREAQKNGGRGRREDRRFRPSRLSEFRQRAKGRRRDNPSIYNTPKYFRTKFGPDAHNARCASNHAPMGCAFPINQNLKLRTWWAVLTLAAGHPYRTFRELGCTSRFPVAPMDAQVRMLLAVVGCLNPLVRIWRCFVPGVAFTHYAYDALPFSLYHPGIYRILHPAHYAFVYDIRAVSPPPRTMAPRRVFAPKSQYGDGGRPRRMRASRQKAHTAIGYQVAFWSAH